MFVLNFGADSPATHLPMLAEVPVAGGGTLRVAAEPSSVHFRAHATGFRLEASALAPDPATLNTLATSIEWDATTGELELHAMPHAGSALYYHVDAAGGFHCASRVSLLGDSGVPLEEDAELVPDYFRYRYVTPPYTLFRGIRQLAKAELRVRLSAGRCSPGTPRLYAVFPDAPADVSDARAFTDRTLEIFERSFEELRPRGSSVIVPLSGGMDSSVLFQLAQRAFGASDAWSAGYPFETDARNRERAYAATAAEGFGARHHYFSGSTPRYLRALVRAIAAAEEPLHHLQSPMFELLFRDAVPAERDVVVLGVGAGGIFGAPLQQLLHHNARHPRFWQALGGSPLAPWIARASRATGRGRRFARRAGLPARLGREMPHPDSLIASVDAYGDAAWIMQRFGASPADLVRSRSELLAHYAKHDALDGVGVIDLFDKTQFLWAKILASVGRRAHFPLMQADLQRHVLGAPRELRLGSNKPLLADVARRIGVPEFILGRAKSGFGVQREDWAERGGPLEPLVALASKRVDAAELRALQSRDPGLGQAFWCLLNLGLWRRLCLDGEPPDTLLAELPEA